MDDDDFVRTLSDDENLIDDEEEEEAASPPPKLAKKATKSQKRKRPNGDDSGRDADAGANEDLESDFDFELEDAGGLEEFDGWNIGAESGPSKSAGVDVDDIIARRTGKRQKLSPQASDSEEAEDEEEDEEQAEDLSDEEEDDVAGIDGFGRAAVLDDEEELDGDDGSNSDELSASEDEDGEGNDKDFAEAAAHPDDVEAESASENGEDPAEVTKRNAFFAPESNLEGQKAPTSTTNATFAGFSLSRPILKGLTSVGFGAPTPIQAKSIPVALLGKDVVGGAQTGSGKTAAFLIPILERLLYRPKKVATTRVAILMPTRELALQCFAVAKKLAAFTDITFAQAIGGLNSREQEKELKKRPDIVIGTPGRFIDFMRNSSSFAVDTIEILVLDEADRMLEEGFADELNEILTTIPKSRQTMLFSATMTSKVDDLIRVGLQRPVRLMVDSQNSTVAGLVQEFVRLRPGREQKRLGYLLHICRKVHTSRVIIFFRQKKEAHRVRIVFGLCGLKAAELHGSMTQEQRIQAIESFRSGQASYLLATDLASRGLDIKGIETVINYEAPQSHEIYLHRVGRTARAGRTGKSCTLAAEPDRKVVKLAVKAAKAQGAVIRQRTIDSKDADVSFAHVESLEDEIEAVLREEKEEKAMQTMEKQISRADNVMKYQDEIQARPRKTWFQSEKDKEVAKGKGRVELNGPEAEKSKPKKGKLSNKEKKKLMDKDDRAAGNEWKKGKNDVAGGKPSGKPSGTSGARGGKAGGGRGRGGGGRGRGGGGGGRGRGGKR